MTGHVDPESDPTVVEVLRAVPVDTIATAMDLPAELRDRVAEMATFGTTLVDIAEVDTGDGWELVVIPLEPDTFIPTHDVEDDDPTPIVEPTEVQYPSPDWDGDDEYADVDDEEYDDTQTYPGRSVLDRLRGLFGKGVSFEQENARIARNRKRAAARSPHPFERAVWSTRKGVVRCRVCGGPAPVDGDLCAGIMAKDYGPSMIGEPMDEPSGGDDLCIGDLTMRQAAYATAVDYIADTLGAWTPYDAHLMTKSPFVDDGICCDNCVAYCRAEQCCDWVSGPIPAAGVCKLWTIPDAYRTDSPVPLRKEIVETGDGFCVTSADGARSFGCYPTRAEAEARLAQVERFGKAATKTEDGEQFPAEAFAYVPDPERPSTWKLRLWDSVAEKETAAQVGRAVAALTSGFRGNKVDIPAADRDAVIGRVRAAWRRTHPGQNVPPILKAADTYVPPQGVRDEAQRAVRWIADGQAGSGFTAVGRRRASDLAAGRGVSLDTIQRMSSYLARHAVDKKGQGWSPGEDGYPSAGRVAWAAWGGDPAVSWTRSILSSVEKDGPTVSDVHVDVPMGSGRSTRRRRPVGRPMIDNTGAVASSVAGVFTKSDEQRYTLGPWYVPDAYDAHGEWTDADELQTALWDYVRAGDRSIRLQHDTDVVAGEWVEALTWPYPVTVPLFDVESSSTVDHEFPAGTVFMGVVWEPWAWDLVKQGKIRGYSMGGRGQRVAVDIETEGTEL